MLRTLWNALLRRVRLMVVLGAVGALGGIVSFYIAEMNHDGLSASAGPEQISADSSSSEQAWGDALLENINRCVIAVLPIRVANACGLGASSCFRCHNGKRAASPGADPKKNPWHKQHEVVNYSCAGCHKGNPRLMKKKIAHSRLIADPRQQPAKSCFNCHTADDSQKLVDRYLQLSKKGE